MNEHKHHTKITTDDFSDNVSEHSTSFNRRDDSPENSVVYINESDIMEEDILNDVTSKLATSGPSGVAAAAAIKSARKKGKTLRFETNPVKRKRDQNRLIRKLRSTINEYIAKVGQQAVVLIAMPGDHKNLSISSNDRYKVYGAQPLEDVIKNLRSPIMENLEEELSNHAPPPTLDLEGQELFELPPLIIDGIPIPVDRMTQTQLRAFIPLMLKFSTGRGKPGWGRESTKPPWWPSIVPWANIRMDKRTELQKREVSWTWALKTVVKECYKYHGREDLLPQFNEIFRENDGDTKEETKILNSVPNEVLTIHTVTNDDGTVTVVNSSDMDVPNNSICQIQHVGNMHSKVEEKEVVPFKEIPLEQIKCEVMNLDWEAMRKTQNSYILTNQSPIDSTDSCTLYVYQSGIITISKCAEPE